jgi:RNA polymerase sigma factor (TIGR02999 family)
VDRGDPASSEVPQSVRRERADELVRELYVELRKLAAAMLARDPAERAIQARDLVHEAYLRLVGNRDSRWNGRGHFFGAAARAMRFILVERARRGASLKHGGGSRGLDVDNAEIPVTPDSEEILTLNGALDRLQANDARKAEIVQLRFLAGLTIDEIASALDVSVSTIEREWRQARQWLRAELSR